jgi:spermidine/putrescine-binding protein
VPAGYQALGIFYNRKYFLRPSEMQTWSDFSKEVQNIAKKYSNIIPVAF